MPGTKISDHRKDPREPPPGKPGSLPPGIVRDHRKTGIECIFVLMLENRSFDHMLGFSPIEGTDAVTGKKTTIHGLKGTESNTFGGKSYTVQQGANNVMPVDPGHEFPDVLVQLCGPGAVYLHGGAYPAINNSGFVASYVHSGGTGSPGEIMKCYTPKELPVLNALAREFVVCDNWYASMPGPTWPNRMFAHAGSSGGLDHSPEDHEIIEWETSPGGGFGFKNGTLYDQLNQAKIKFRFYAGDDFPMVAGLKGVSIFEIRDYSEHFAKDLQSQSLDFKYAFIEPSYDVLNHYRNVASQHPLANVTHGEAFIKATYETIRNSPVWAKSLLIITWDEHGGFYDHVDSGKPPQCVAPGDTTPGAKYNQYGFTFEHYGPRVPAIVASPLIPKNVIDHRIYDHSSIPATAERVFGAHELTMRDSFANGLNSLAQLKTARTDAPKTLPAVAAESMALITSAPVIGAASMVNPEAPVKGGNLPGILHSALHQDLQISDPKDRPAIIARVQSIKTRGDAMRYMAEVQQKVRPRRHPTSTSATRRPPTGPSRSPR